MYAVMGITGQVGGVVAETLLAAGEPVRAIVRDVRKGAAWEARGCDVAVAEVQDASALAQAFAGSEAVFVMLPPMFDPSPDFAEARTAIDAIRGALAAAKPGRVVGLSTVGAQNTRPNLLGQLSSMERRLGTLDLPIAFVRAAWFMENAVWDVPAAQAGMLRSFLQPLDRAIPMVATADIGATVARLLREQWTGRRVVELQGPAPVSPNELAAAFTRLLGTPVGADVVNPADWEGLFRAEGMRNPVPRMQMLHGFNEGWITFEGGAGVEAVTGPTTLDSVLRRLLAHGS